MARLINNYRDLGKESPPGVRFAESLEDAERDRPRVGDVYSIGHVLHVWDGREWTCYYPHQASNQPATVSELSYQPLLDLEEVAALEEATTIKALKSVLTDILIKLAQ